jgi:quinol monooxygenase YgiN
MLQPSINQPAPRRATGAVTRRNIFLRMLALAAAFPIPGMLRSRAFAEGNEEGGQRFYKIVSYEVPPEGWQEFLAMGKANAEASLKDPGLISFDLLLSRDAANTVIAVEAYRDEDASKAHQQTGHFRAFVDGAQRLGVKRSVVTATRYFPS